MSEEFKLNPGEEVIKRNNEVGYGSGIVKAHGELILTNQALIFVKKGLLGKTKDVERYALSDIVISNNQAQVKVGKMDNVTHTLDVYFQSGMESFIFTWEDEIKDWANSINTMLTGQPDIYKKEDWLGEMEHVTEAFTGAVKKVRKVFGIKSTEQVSCKCPSCGASLTGIEGETIRCPYCGNNFTF